jgi:Flp pilus assembly protein CpaB
MNSSDDKHLRSVRCALWTLVVVVGLGALAAILLVVSVAWVAMEGRKDPNSDSTLVVVASTNVASGTVLTRQHLGKKRISDANLPNRYACLHTADLLIGHAIFYDLKRGDPIDLTRTDLWKQPTLPAYPPVGRGE